MVDSILINTPVSSPLHPQLNLPLLKKYLENDGFSAKVLDANIRFFHEFLGGIPPLREEEWQDNPLSLLAYYNNLEQQLFDKSKAYRGLQVGLRSLGMQYDRLFFDSVIQSLADEAANPFIAFWDRVVEQDLLSLAPCIVGIAITFQDQIIPAFTLARCLREKLPGVAIVMGGQMITRCQDSMASHDGIMSLVDYLVLWDGEEPLLALHRHLLRGDGAADLTNVIDAKTRSGRIQRESATPKQAIPRPDFSDLDFRDYLLPELLVPLQSTRGCYAQCAFCAIPFGSNKYQVRDAHAVIEDMLAVQAQTEKQTGRKATYFKFMEDTSSPSILHQIATLIIEQDIEGKWETFARLERAFAKPGFLEHLYKGGCRKIHWGLESNDPDILVKMAKKNEMSHTNEILAAAAKAGILNFCFILVGFPGETDEMRENLTRYICDNPDIHTLTIATFDLTRKSPMAETFTPDNPYGLTMVEASDFQVRLPYLVDGENWKEKIIPAAHRMMIDIIRNRPDIGFVTLFPDQVRSMLCDRFGNDWGRIFVKQYGVDNVRTMLLDTERYVMDYQNKRDFDQTSLPEPLKREHQRTKEDMLILAQAIKSRKLYENRRINQV